MSNSDTKVLDEVVGEGVKSEPGSDLVSLYRAWHAANEAAISAQVAADAADIEDRRRLMPACLALLDEHERVGHKEKAALYAKCGLSDRTCRKHLALAKVYRLISESQRDELAAAGTLLSAKQGAALARAFSYRKRFGLNPKKSDEKIAEFAIDCARLNVGPEAIKQQLDEYAEQLEDARAAHGGSVVKVPASMLREMATRISTIVKPNSVKPQMLLVEALKAGELRLSTTVASEKFEATATARARLQKGQNGEFRIQVAALEILRAVLANKEDVVRLGFKPGEDGEDAKLLVIFGQGQNRVVREFEDDPSGEVVVTQDKDEGCIVEVHGFGPLIRSIGRFANAEHNPAISVGVDDSGGVVLATDGHTAVKTRADVRGARGAKVLLPASEAMAIATAFNTEDPVRVAADGSYLFLSQSLKDGEGSIVFAVRESARIADIEKVISAWKSDASFVIKAGEMRKVFAGFGSSNRNRTEFYFDSRERRLGIQWNEPRQRMVTAIEVNEAQGDPRGFSLSRKVIGLILRTVDTDALRFSLPTQSNSLVRIEGANICYYLSQIPGLPLTAMPEAPTARDLEDLELPEASPDALILRAANVEDLCAQLRERLADTDGPITARIEVGQGGDEEDDDDGPDDGLDGGDEGAAADGDDDEDPADEPQGDGEGSGGKDQDGGDERSVDVSEEQDEAREQGDGPKSAAGEGAGSALPVALRVPPTPWDGSSCTVRFGKQDANRLANALARGERMIELKERERDDLDGFPGEVQEFIKASVPGRLALVHAGRMEGEPYFGKRQWFAMIFPVWAPPALDAKLVEKMESLGWEMLPERSFAQTFCMIIGYDLHAENAHDLPAIAACEVMARAAAVGLGEDDRPNMPVLVNEFSGNRKTGAISNTFVTQASCPASCPHRLNGCYAEHGTSFFVTRRLNASPVRDPVKIAEIEAALIDQLPGTVDLRLDEVGDCATEEAARKRSSACVRLEERSPNGSKCFGYTHGWREVPVEAHQGISILASCETSDDVRDAQQRGYATAIVVPEYTSDRVYERDGLRILPCPNETRGVQCVSCRLCMRGEMLREQGLTIAFTPHGSGQRMIKNTLASCGSKKGGK